MAEGNNGRHSIMIGDDFKIEANTHGWSLSEFRPRKDKDGNFKISAQVTYPGTLKQAFLAAFEKRMARDLGPNTSLKDAITQMQAVERELVDAIKDAGYAPKQYQDPSRANDRSITSRTAKQPKATTKPEPKPEPEAPPKQDRRDETPDIGEAPPKRKSIKITRKNSGDPDAPPKKKGGVTIRRSKK